MKSQTTLYLHLGRADPRPLVTVDDSNNDQSAIFEAHKQCQMSDAIRSGVDLSRVSFSTETVELPEPEKAKVTVKKGGRQ